ncbi:Cyclin [Melia azedarach]|uniref:Cyclin n=1 Tax=Melia azedarach TaxID=155640 RepID=A0ACC1Z1Z7_MELAZ|nr:Cyclin [Melia azedarach]
MEFNLEDPFTNFQDFINDEAEATEPLFLIESDHMPSENYIRSLKSRDLDVSLRQLAISSILQCSCKFDPLLSYLAVNYLDRFLSSLEMQQPKPWMLRLLAVSCLSLAAKMRKMEFSLTDFQAAEGLIFDTQTIQRMEYLILGALKWRMRSITPFSFISLFIDLLKLKDPPLEQALKNRATEIILKAQYDIKLLEFKPSVIAASALLSASRELFPLQFSCFRKALITSCSYVNKENMLQCYNAMEDIISMEGYYESGFDTVSSSDTPVNVLDRRFSSSESDKTSVITTTTNTITTTNTTKLSPERDTKRRKVSGYCNNRSIQLSQIQQC